jgi:hypothetical protein
MSGNEDRALVRLPCQVFLHAVLDVLMLFTTIGPLIFPQAFASFSSFLSNYTFSRLFIEFVFESVPQTLLQLYIYRALSREAHAGGGVHGHVGGGGGGGGPTAPDGSAPALQAVQLSLVVSGINVLK